MNKRITLVLSLMLTVFSLALAQIQEPAKWTVELSKTDVKVGEKIDVVFKASIEDTWHTYSNDFDPELGPILISFEFEENGSYERVGKVKPINAHKKYDEIWEGEVSYFEGTAEMRQTITVKELPLNIAGTFEFQELLRRNRHVRNGR